VGRSDRIAHDLGSPPWRPLRTAAPGRPTAARDVIRSNPASSAAGAATGQVLPLLGASCVLHQDGDSHRDRRRTLNPLFHGDSLTLKGPETPSRRLDQPGWSRRGCSQCCSASFTPGPSRLRAPRVGEDGHVREGRRDLCVAPPGGGPWSPGRPSPLHLVGPGADRPARRPHPTTAVDGIRGHGEDDPRLAPASRGSTLDLPAAATRATTT